MREYTFTGLAEAGFRHLLPIVPHDAKISVHSKTLEEGMLGKVPGQLRSDGWVGFAKWVEAVPTSKDYATWDQDGAGIGIRCHDVVAVDIDVTDDALAEMIQGMALSSLGFAPCRVGRPPKRLLLYRLKEPGSWPTKQQLAFRDDDNENHLLEILGSRQQCVLQGVHPGTGKPYTWDMELADGPDGLPAVTPEELTAFLQEVKDMLDLLGHETGRISRAGQEDARDVETLSGDVELVRDLVRHIPNSELNGYQELSTMAHAVWAACQSDLATGEEILLEWAEKWPNGADLTEAQRIFGTIHESSIGVQWLQHEAARNGYQNAQADFQEVLDQISEDDMDQELDERSFWTRYVYVNQTKRFIDTLTGIWMDKEQFNDSLGKLGDNQTASTFFMENRWPTQFCNKMDYRPGCRDAVLPDGYGGYAFNGWRPGPAHGNGDWSGVLRSRVALEMWQKLVKHLFPDAEERGALLDWMAYLIQKPGEKPNWHPLIGGHTHGTGKDSIFIPLMKGLGDNARTIRTGDLEGEWTWWAENVQLVVVSEINSFERRAVMNRLKSFMANPPFTVEINKKGIPQYEVPNLFGMVMFTNNEDAVAIEQSDRRFFVLWTHADPLPESFYVQYHDFFTYSEIGPATVIDYLKERDISGRSFQGRAPQTGAKEDMRLAAMPAIEGQLMFAIESEEGPFRRDLLTIQEIETFIRARAASGKMVSPQKLAIHLRAAGAKYLGRVRLTNGERTRLWAVRRADTYLQLDPTKARDMYETSLKNEELSDFEGVDAGSL